jgi:hypothetical protein
VKAEPINVSRGAGSKVTLIVPMGQFKRSSYSFLVDTLDLGNTMSFKAPAGGDVCGFDVFITKPDGTVQVLAKYYSSEVAPRTAPPFVYWKYNGSEIEATFSMDYRHYKPSIGDTMNIVVYETEGVKGNIKYFGNDYSIVYPSEVEGQSQYLGNIFIESKLSGDIATGGTNEKTFEELKEYSTRINTTKGIINSEAEINQHFKDKGVDFEEIRKDNLRAVYRGNVIAKTDKGIIPTRTVDMVVDPEVSGPFKDKLLTLREASCYSPLSEDPHGIDKTYKHNQEMSTQFFDWENNLGEVFDMDEAGTLMSCPFNIRILENGPGVALTTFFTDEVVSMRGTHSVDRSIHQTPIFYTNVKRNPILDDGWLIDIPVMLDPITLEEFKADPTVLTIGIGIRGKETYEVATLADGFYVDSELPDVYHFTKTLRTDNATDIFGNIRILTDANMANGRTGSKIVNEFFYISPEIEIDVVTFYKDGVNPFVDEGHPLVVNGIFSNILNELYKMFSAYGMERKITLGDDFTDFFMPYIEPIFGPKEYHVFEEDKPRRYLTDKYDVGYNEGELVTTLVKKAGELVYDAQGNVEYEHRKGDPDLSRPRVRSVVYKLENIPLVKSVYLLDDKRSSAFYQSIRDMRAEMKSDTFVRGSNITFMFRYMNCFGPSSEYFAYKGDDYKQLSRVDTQLTFRAKMAASVDVTQRPIILSEMKTIIKDMVSTTNSAGGFNINDIITRLTNTYKTQLEKLEFVSINNLPTEFQSIGRVASNDVNTAADYITIREKLNRAAFMQKSLVFDVDIDIALITQ